MSSTQIRINDLSELLCPLCDEEMQGHSVGAPVDGGIRLWGICPTHGMLAFIYNTNDGKILTATKQVIHVPKKKKNKKFVPLRSLFENYDGNKEEFQESKNDSESSRNT